MTITFVSNYINHHQIPLSTRLHAALGDGYHFIQVMPMEEERRQMGWSVDRDELPYLLCYYECEDRCKRLIMDSDVVIFGGVEDESYIEDRLRSGRIIIRYSERLYREGQWKAISPRGLLRKYKDHTRYRNAPVYLLTTGAYTASDFHIVRAYPGKMYKWGYFTEFVDYPDIEKLINDKGRDVRAELLFAGRFIPLKHPEYPIELAAHLKQKGIPFHLTMVGDGEMMESLKEQTVRLAVQDEVSFEGFKSPTEVRSYMEKADILLMTSNHLEGWGAVINEAMNSGCTVIATDTIGAVPYLIQHGVNGMVFREGDLKEFISYGEQLVSDRALCHRLGREAYRTIAKRWNPDYAAGSLLAFAGSLLGEGNNNAIVNERGPLSPAPIIRPGEGYRYVRKGVEP